MNDRRLLLEVWQEIEDEGETFSLILAGPRGVQARQLLGSNARLVKVISAGSHFEAMTSYYKLLGWGVYTTDQPDDYQPYSREWMLEQRMSR